MVGLHRFILSALFAMVVTSTPSFSSPLFGVSSALRDAPDEERATIDQLLGSAAWPRRVIALMRLQRFDCEESAEMITLGLDDLAPKCEALLP